MEMTIWCKRSRWLLELVKKFSMGKVRDLHNLIRDCKKIHLDPQQMTTQALDMEVFIVVKKYELRLKAPEFCRQHLKNRLQLAKDQQDEKGAVDY